MTLLLISMLLHSTIFTKLYIIYCIELAILVRNVISHIIHMYSEIRQHFSNSVLLNIFFCSQYILVDVLHEPEVGPLGVDLVDAPGTQLVHQPSRQQKVLPY